MISFSLSLTELSREELPHGNQGGLAAKGERESDPELSVLYLGAEDIVDEDVQRLVEALKENHTVRVLDLPSNKIRDVGAKVFGASVEREPYTYGTESL